MPTYKFSISELVYRHSSGVEIEAASLKDAMAELAERVLSPDFHWGSLAHDMMVLELSVVDDDDEEVILEDTRTRENGTLFMMWPEHMVEDGRVWEGEEGGGYDVGGYPMDSLPSRVADLIEKEEDQAE